MRAPATDLPTPRPTRAEWQQLITAAQSFKQAQPWEWMHEEQIFGVRDPESGDVGYCSITGTLGEHLALIVYLGAQQGLGHYYYALATMATAQTYLDEHEGSGALLETPQLQASFEARQYLDKVDYNVLKELGLRFRGKHAWPLFRHYQPGRLPWFINGTQARFLTVMLQQALQVAEDALTSGETAELLKAAVTPLQARVDILMRAQEDGLWQTRVETVEPAYPEYLINYDEDSFDAIRRQLPQQNVQLQVYLQILFATPVEEGPLPPYLPYQLLVVDAQSGFIFGTDLLLANPSVEAVLKRVSQSLIQLFQRMEFRPREVQVSSERLYGLLAVPMGRLGIALTRHTELPALEEALYALDMWIRGNPLGDDGV